MTMRNAAGGAGGYDEPERGPGEERVEDPAGRPEPYVKGPTGAAPLATELRGDPGDEGDRKGEGGAAAGAIAGTSLAGPVGGVVGAMAGGALGGAADDGPEHESLSEEAAESHPGDDRYSNVDRDERR